MQSEKQVEALLTSQLDDPRGLAQAVAIRAPHWAHSGIISPGDRREIIVERRIELICRMGVPAVRFGLTRRPAASKATLHGSHLTADTPGVYIVALELAGFVRAIPLVAVTPELLDSIGPVRGTNDRILTLRSRLNDPAWDVDTLARALEANNPANWGALAAPTH